MSPSQSLLLQAPISATPCIPILPEGELHKLNHGLALGRVHQACGSARHRLALWLAAQNYGASLLDCTKVEHRTIKPVRNDVFY